MRSTCRRSWVRRVAEFGRGVRAVIASAPLVLMAGPALAATVTVVIEGMQFSPAVVTVQRGDTVVWVNRDMVPHTATAAGAFDSRTIVPGASWAYVARTAGRHDYACTLHPSMRAMLQIE